MCFRWACSEQPTPAWCTFSTSSSATRVWTHRSSPCARAPGPTLTAAACSSREYSTATLKSWRWPRKTEAPKSLFWCCGVIIFGLFWLFFVQTYDVSILMCEAVPSKEPRLRWVHLIKMETDSRIQVCIIYLERVKIFRVFLVIYLSQWLWPKKNVLTGNSPLVIKCIWIL